MNKIQVSNEKKLTILLLCCLVGLFGVHRFYAGKSFSGVIQFLTLCLSGVLIHLEARPLMALPVLSLLLWWTLDVLLIIMGKFTDKEGKPILDWI